MATIFLHDSHHRESLPHAPIECVSDGLLMDRFIDDKDESAFAELVRRHSSMVLGVCQRVLHNAHDSEDCFQAAFLVLVRKADTIQPREMVGNWLYGVAYRTALEARKLSARRRDMERKKPTEPPTNPAHELWQELRPVLDQELSRLPDKYRAVLIACDLEGKTRHEAAALLGLPEGTVASRLARARAMLSKRVAKYSLAMNTNLLIAVFAENVAQTDVPPSLLERTINAGASLASGESNALVSGRAASLADAVVQSMGLAKLKVAAALIAILCVLGLGLSALIPAVQAQRKPDVNNHEAQKKGFDPKKVKPQLLSDCVLQKLDLGNWALYARRSSFANEDGTALYEVQVTPHTVVVIDGREARLADLKLGDTFNMQIQRQVDGPPRALRIETTGVELMGTIDAMTQHSVTIQSDPRGKKQIDETTFELDDKVLVSIDGKKAVKIGDLKVRMKVTIKVPADKSKGIKIQAVGPKVAAVIKKVDAEKQTVSLHIDEAHMVADGIAVSPDAPVLIDGKQRKLADLRAGTRVNVWMSADAAHSQIVEITVPAQPTVVRRQVK